MVVGPRPEADLLHLDVMLVLAIKPLLLLQLVTNLAPVHEAHHGRAGVGGDLNEIEPLFLGGFTSLLKGNDADLLAIGAYEADGTDANLVVDA